MRVTFVCSGNICRSPAAHAVFARWCARDPLLVGRFHVESAGIGAWHVGELPDPRAVSEGKKRQYSLDHFARQVAAVDFTGLLVAMDSGHERSLRSLAPRGFDAARIVLFRSFDPLAAGDLEVADPYYGGSGGFVEMFDVIERTVPRLAGWAAEVVG